jgi:hypothetical protein
MSGPATFAAAAVPKLLIAVFLLERNQLVQFVSSLAAATVLARDFRDLVNDGLDARLRGDLLDQIAESTHRVLGFRIWPLRLAGESPWL